MASATEEKSQNQGLSRPALTSSDDETTTVTSSAVDDVTVKKKWCLCCGGKCPPWRVLVTLIACIAVEATLGVTYTNGNLMPYLTSYLRNVTEETSVDYNQTLWISNSLWLVLSVSVPVWGLIEQRIPRRLYFLIGLVLNSAAFFGTYWAVQESFVLTIVIYGVVQGLGQSALYPGCINLALKWFPHRKGLVAGTVISGYGGGAFVWNQVVTQWVNPDNLQPDQAEGDNLYFTQSDVLDNVPTCFLLLGGLITAVQLLCYLSFAYPPPPSPTRSKDTLNTEEEEKLLEEGAHQALLNHSQRERSPKNRSKGIPMESESAEAFLPLNQGETAPKNRAKVNTEESESAEALREVLLLNNSESQGENSPKNRTEGIIEEAKSAEEKSPELVSSKGDMETRETPHKDEDRTDRGLDAYNGQALSGQSLPLHNCGCKSPLTQEQTTLVKIPDYTPLQVLTSRATWTLWLSNFSTDLAFIFIPAFYKAYGQTFIHDDHLLSLVASFAAVFNAGGRPVWGLVADRIGYLPCMLVSQGIMLVMSATILLCEKAGSPAMFAVWVFAIYIGFSGICALQSPFVFAMFGARNFIFALGVCTSTTAVSVFITVPLSSAVSAAFGWPGVFLAAAGGALMSMVFLSSLLVSCGHPIPPHMRAGLISPRRLTKDNASSSNSSSSDS